jgi:hypothetical protein
VSEIHASINNWRAPTDLQPASFDDTPTNGTPNIAPPILGETNDTPKNGEPFNNTILLEKVIPLIGKINSGGLDMASVLDLLDKSGQGFGALGKLLPLVAPLMQNGGLGSLFNGKKKPTEDTIDLKTINLDN